MRPLALTLGDPAGIGPEIAAAAWRSLGRDLPLFVIGCPDTLAAAGAPVRVIAQPEEATAGSGLAVLPEPLANPARPGHPDPANAPAVVRMIERATRLVLDGRASALCTNPISKKVLKDGAAFAFPGHTEFLAHLTGAPRPVMMIAGPGLRVVPVTIHDPIAAVPSLLTGPLLEETIRITDAALRRDFGIARPRLAVAGLNPHAGEGGTIGREEIDLIAPLVARLVAEGLDLSGPLSADTMFHPAARATYDAAICMYHDQALIPAKTLFFDEGVNVTLGLPVIRTSPDHGTAFDIAGKGMASPASLIAALRLAATLAEARAGRA